MRSFPANQQAGEQSNSLSEKWDESETEIAVIRTAAQWDALEAEWRSLFDASPTASPPLRWEWLRDWQRIYGPAYACANGKEDGLRIYTVRIKGRLAAALPLYLNRKGRLAANSKRLMFLSTGEAESEELCAEYLDLLHLPGVGDKCATLLCKTILEDRSPDWDVLELHSLSAQSPLCAWSAASVLPGVELREHGPSYVTDLSEGFESYINRLSSNSRGLARKRMRGAERAGARLEVACDGVGAEEMFEELRILHQARWEQEGQPGCFASQRFQEFHLSQVRRGVSLGQTILARLRHDDKTLAVLLGYTAGQKFDSYVAGARLEEAEGVKSPGIVLHLLLTEYMSQQGYRYYDHLAGDARYKQQYTTEELARCGIYLERPTLRTALGKTADIARKVLRKGKGLLALKPVSPSTDGGI